MNAPHPRVAVAAHPNAPRIPPASNGTRVRSPGHNRPIAGVVTDTLNRLAILLQERLEQLASAARDGAVIAAYTCIHAPVELLEACGAVPVRLPFAADSDAQTQGATLLRPDACPLCCALVGARRRHDPVASLATCLVSPTTCDAMRRAPQVWPAEFGVPLFQFMSPRTWHGKASRAAYLQELIWLRDELEALTCVRATSERLAASMARWERARASLRRIHSLRARLDLPVTGADLARLAAYAFVLDPDAFSAEVEALVAVLCQAAPTAVPAGRTVRLMLMGSPCLASDAWLLDTLEADGRARIVADALCTCARWFHISPKAAGSPLDSLADAYMHQPACAFSRPNDRLYRFIENQIAAAKPHGLVLRTLRFCDAWALEAERMRRSFRLPMLYLDVDYSQSVRGQLATRTEAFLEVLA